MDLDDAGITLAAFKNLLIICDRCSNWVGTKSAFEDHICTAEVIDLTLDD